MSTEGGGGNLAALGLIQIFRLVSGLAINVMLMQGLGVESFGIYGYVSILVGMASFGSSMGMDRLLKREISRDENTVGHYVATGMAASALLSVGTGIGILGWAWLMDGRASVVASAGLAASALTLQSLALVPVSAYHAMRRMGRTVYGNAVGRLVLVAATALFLSFQLGVTSVFAAQILDAMVSFLIVWFLYRRDLGNYRLQTSWNAVSELIRTSLPFGMNALFVSIYLQIDVILLANLQGDHETGLYRGAVMLLSLFPIVAETLSNGIYPRMSRHLGNRTLAGEELAFATRVLLAISVPAAVGGLMTASALLVFLGGKSFAASALLFQVMVPLLPMRFLNNAFGMTMSALNHQEDRTRGAIYAALVNVSINLYAIPEYGALGAAFATLVTEILLIVFMRWRISALVTNLRIGESLLRVGIPAAIMALVLWLLPPVHVILQILAGILVYAAVGRASGAWHPRDLRRLKGV